MAFSGRGDHSRRRSGRPAAARASHHRTTKRSGCSSVADRVFLRYLGQHCQRCTDGSMVDCSKRLRRRSKALQVVDRSGLEPPHHLSGTEGSNPARPSAEPQRLNPQSHVVALRRQAEAASNKSAIPSPRTSVGNAHRQSQVMHSLGQCRGFQPVR